MLIVGDHTVSIPAARQFRDAGIATDLDSALGVAKTMNPRVCIIDSGLEGGALGVASELRRIAPDVGIVVLGESFGGSEVLDAIVAGARGYALKSFDGQSLRDRVERLCRGEAAIPEEALINLLDELERRERAAVRRRMLGQRLTERELEVLELLSDGLGTRKIADRLFISAVTVRSHIASLVRKLDVNGRVEAIAYYRRLDRRV